VPAVESERSLAAVLAEVKEELKDFVQTRVAMLRFELREKAHAWKLALPLAACALALLITSWCVFTAALIAIVASAFYPNRFAYFFGLLIVGGAYALGGTMFAAQAYRSLRRQGMVPERTVRILKEDAEWLRREARRAA
jgi:hypothetical protein